MDRPDQPDTGMGPRPGPPPGAAAGFPAGLGRPELTARTCRTSRVGRGGCGADAVERAHRRGDDEPGAVHRRHRVRRPTDELRSLVADRRVQAMIGLGYFAAVAVPMAVLVWAITWPVD